jgi:S1-C subfamily serine protease
MRLCSRLVLIVTLCCIINPAVWAEKGVNEAVVKIYTVYNRYDYDEPWQMVGQSRRSGSGCIIRGRRILTSAHVIGDQTFIQVRRAGEAKKYTAAVEVVAHECDLAILKVNDDSLFSGVEPVEIGDLAEVRDKVVVYGFPKGGDELCITEGVVSRIEHHEYTHSRAYLLTCQIDASINPGSSGGPVVKGDEVVGVAFQSAESGENIGYMVPAPVINHFLTDIRDGTYDGIPGLGISWQKMESPDLRLKFGMAQTQTGVLVNSIYPGSPAKGILKPEDIILSIDGQNVENDGTIEFRKGERTFFGYVAQRKYIDDTVKLGILRENNLMDMLIRLSKPLHFWQLVPHERYDVAPTYYILGGLVFEPLTLNYLKTWGKWYYNAPLHLIHYYIHGEPREDQREIVVLAKVLADEVNVGYHNLKNRVISHVNGKKISTMEDLVKAFEEHEGSYHVIVDERGYKIVLDKGKVDRSSQGILKKYKINADRSKDLELW